MSLRHIFQNNWINNNHRHIEWLDWITVILTFLKRLIWRQDNRLFFVIFQKICQEIKSSVFEGLPVSFNDLVKNYLLIKTVSLKSNQGRIRSIFGTLFFELTGHFFLKTTWLPVGKKSLNF